VIVLSDEQVIKAIDHASLVNVLALAFKRGAETPLRMHNHLPGDDNAQLLLMPSWDGRDAIGVKVVAVAPSNRDRGRPTVDGVYVLMHGETGEPLAVLSARALTALRTAAVSALASSLLARADAKVLLMIGAGALAPYLVKSHLSVRPLDRIMLWGRNLQRASDLADRLSELAIDIEVAEHLPEALGEADIISCATLSREPLIEGARLRPGCHVDLVGSFAPDMREADMDVFRRGRLVVDTGAAFDESGDLIAPLQAGVISREAPDLAALLNSRGLGRRNPDEITVFKTVGTGLADLAVARHIVSSVTAHDPAFFSGQRNIL